ncbi:MAG: TetR/AcrR family transcriptional regulator [Myxococcales bacterium]
MTSDDEGLRERKKRETRQAISDVATRLFQERGFENVSVSEIASAANVSKMTVFNYFARKEDLYFDRGVSDLALVEQALRERAANVSPIAALQMLAHRMVDERQIQAKFTAGVGAFWRTVKESPALRARAREMRDELETGLTELLQNSIGRKEPSARLIASMLTAAWRVAYTTALRRQRAGDSAQEVRAAFLATLDEAFTILRRGAPGSPFL